MFIIVQNLMLFVDCRIAFNLFIFLLILEAQCGVFNQDSTLYILHSP
jgi:hypothetical protein